MSSENTQIGAGAGPGRCAGAPRPPEGWPVTDRPLRIALLGWARLSAQVWQGSGYNWSASELARGLIMSGHQVSYLQSGMTYRLIGGARVRFVETWAGVKCFDLVNSPNLSPSASNLRNTAREISSPAQSALVVRWLDEVGAEVVHIHSMEGYGLDLIGAIRDSGRPVVVTPHNYAFVCPQVDLLHEETRVCTDYDGGRRCGGCLPAEAPGVTKLRRAVREALESSVGRRAAEAAHLVLKRGKGIAMRLAGRGGARVDESAVAPGDRLVDPELGRGFVTGGYDSDGLIRHDLALAPSEKPLPFEPSPGDQNERFLAPAARDGQDVHLRVLNEYGRRRLAGVDALNRASLVIPPSDFLRRVHVRMGVEEQRTRWVRLGQPHFDQINRRAQRSPYYDKHPWDPDNATRPLRFAFFGTTRSNKGLEVLARAIPLLERGVRERAHFVIRAHGNDWAFRKRLSKYPQVTVYGGYDVYQLINSGGEYDVGILPHIWFENSPLVMLEHLHAGKFVIASRLGGPVDWIEPTRNGLLFAAGHPDQLAERIADVVIGRVPLPSAREVHEATVLRSYPDHVREVEGIYREVIERPEPDTGPGGDSSAAERSDTPEIRTRDGVVRASAESGARQAG